MRGFSCPLRGAHAQGLHLRSPRTAPGDAVPGGHAPDLAFIRRDLAQLPWRRPPSPGKPSHRSKGHLSPGTAVRASCPSGVPRPPPGASYWVLGSMSPGRGPVPAPPPPPPLQQGGDPRPGSPSLPSPGTWSRQQGTAEAPGRPQPQDPAPEAAVTVGGPERRGEGTPGASVSGDDGDEEPGPGH